MSEQVDKKVSNDEKNVEATIPDTVDVVRRNPYDTFALNIVAKQLNTTAEIAGDIKNRMKTFCDDFSSMIPPDYDASIGTNICDKKKKIREENIYNILTYNGIDEKEMTAEELEIFRKYSSQK